MGLKCDFQPRQIVCLEHQNTSLYAEVIQVVESRQVCWVRPILLLEYPQGDRTFLAEPLSYDLRPTVDLLWSCALFRPALDTEILPYLTDLFATPQQESNSLAREQLNKFIVQLWQAQNSET
ncbi:hypothetical protein [Aliterella atlantica]|uniref:Uncharacterized protein n=1 Tax=Aliterella atlantica CENA595 TaxID=1618023 RepID=A0A0D8ZZT6_9CYAN|nr:hypothetical protein [Aliterella atlantica]KJH72721.1 hypothetical protein UH38_05770 [Aliterella atlantica CENA595]